LVSKIAISPLDDSIAIMIRLGDIKLAHRRARDMTWTIEVNLSFSTNGQLLATVQVEGGLKFGTQSRKSVSERLSAIDFGNWHFCQKEIFWQQQHLRMIIRMMVFACTIFSAKLDATNLWPWKSMHRFLN
jgi:hypothetical protein